MVVTEIQWCVLMGVGRGGQNVLFALTQNPLLCVLHFWSMSHFSDSLAGREVGSGRQEWRERKHNPKRYIFRLLASLVERLQGGANGNAFSK
jgi:hypothetical protein